VQALLEPRQRDLAEDGAEGLLDEAAQQREAGARRALLAAQAVEDQHLAEDAGGLGHGQRRVGLQVAAVARQVLVHAVAELVRQGHHVARVAEVAEQHVGMRARHGARAEGAAALAVAHVGIDPAPIEEARRFRACGRSPIDSSTRRAPPTRHHLRAVIGAAIW
jgi:hypothetical protein